VTRLAAMVRRPMPEREALACSIERVSRQGIGIALVVVSAIGFGSGPFFAIGAYDAGMSAIPIVFWRFLFAALVSWAFVLAFPANRSALHALTRPRVLALLFLGVLYAGNSGTYVASLQTVPVSLSAVIVYLYPAIVAVLSMRFGRSLDSRRAWLALCVSMVGVALAVGATPPSAMPPLSGLILAFSSPVIYAIWIVCSARLAGERRSIDEPPMIPPGDAEAAEEQPDVPDAAPAAALMTTATCAAFAVIGLVFGAPIRPVAVAPGAWPPLIGFGIFSAVAVQAFYAGVRRIGGARASLLSTVEPVYTIALASLLLGQVLTPLQVVGGVLVIGGVILAETAPRTRAGPVTARATGAQGVAQLLDDTPPAPGSRAQG
jgi:drug/metabolite transporter (DMT)-like permease